uniref:Uncharacterized protein n=1 Tax=Triticum urartu TaxID=4572 RepID=A0A8R7PLL1_TRIUA
MKQLQKRDIPRRGTPTPFLGTDQRTHILFRAHLVSDDIGSGFGHFGIAVEDGRHS